jgi:hypothetical protein
MPFAAYRAIDAVNWSTLKEMRRSPLHYWYRTRNPLEDRTQLAFGRATHTAVFEPDRFLLDYALFTGPRRAGKKWKEFLAANTGKTILKVEEYETCLAVRDAVRSHPIAGPALSPPGEAEKVLTWTDSYTGIKCKARLDWYRPGLFADLKTTVSVNADRFGLTAARMGYHCQVAFYRAGLIANNLPAPQPRIIAVEAAPPHDVAVFVVDEDVIYAAEQELAALLRNVSAGRFSGQWPGSCPEEQPLKLPGWAFGTVEEEDDLAGLQISN